MNAQRGKSTVTIVVLILVLVVIGVIAVPAWRSHQISTRLADALKVTDAAKLVVMESATVHGGLAHIQASELNYSQAATTSPYVAHITIANDGRISLTTKDTGATPDPVMLLSPSENSGDKGAAPINWNCSVTVGDPDLAPADCRTVIPAAAASGTPANATTVIGASASPAHSS